MKFYICEHCGNLVSMVQDAGVKMVCCGEKMKELVPNTVEAAVEKHIPVITVNNDLVSVNVGSIEHPMTQEHSIKWICLVSEQGFQLKKLQPADPPEASFALTQGDKPTEVYAYCNLHGLWKANVI